MDQIPVIDCDVHHGLRSQEELYPYLSAGWLDYVRGPEPYAHIPMFASTFPYTHPQGPHRNETIPPDGSPPGSSLPFMREQLLDPFGIEHAILNGPGLYVAAGPNPYFTLEIARAVNDHMVEQWLDREPRLSGSVALACQVPEQSAKEIYRLAGRRQVVQAILGTNPHIYGFGHPIFDPIHRAAAETGLPVAIHALGDGTANAGAPHTAGGRPSYYAEMQTGCCEGIMTHLMSFIFHGVFERYTDLRLILVEGGIAWVPAFLRRLDTNYKGLRREVPWCKRLPSEYFRERIYVTTQPLDIGPGDEEYWQLLAKLGLEDNLLFASDYPHWDTDDPKRTQTRIPSQWRDKVLWKNAARTYGLTASVAA